MNQPTVTACVTTRELGLFLDTVSNAQLTLRQVPQLSDILARLVGLANAKSGYIGEVRKGAAETPTPSPAPGIAGSVDG